MREHGLQPGHLQEIPDGDGYRIAFGYLKKPPGARVLQRYFEIPVSREEFLTLDESVRRPILDRLAVRLREKPCS